MSGLCQATYRREMPTSALWIALERLEAWPVTRHDADGRQRSATLQIALDLGWAKTYDAEYVALARSLACSILTTDERLRRGAGRMVDIIGPLDLK